MSLIRNPHETGRNKREKVLEIAIGRQIRVFRKQYDMTVAEMAKMTGLSAGMLSKIENGNTSPSLTTLHRTAPTFFAAMDDCKLSGPAAEKMKISLRRVALVLVNDVPDWRLEVTP